MPRVSTPSSSAALSARCKSPRRGHYPFKPSPDVRSFAQQVAHVADDQYNLCSPALGEKRKAAYTAIEDTSRRRPT
jgi:hypothetical protein